MKHLFSLLFVCLFITGFSQKIDELEYLLKQNVSVHNDTVNINTQIMIEDRELDTKDELLYFWYKAGNIHKSRGGIGGDVLHGKYSEYFENGNLKIQGGFLLGTKDGVWKEWYSNGELRSVVSWKKGQLNGVSKKYDLNGKVQKETNYKDGEIVETKVKKVKKEKVKTDKSSKKSNTDETAK